MTRSSFFISKFDPDFYLGVFLLFKHKFWEYYRNCRLYALMKNQSKEKITTKTKIKVKKCGHNTVIMSSLNLYLNWSEWDVCTICMKVHKIKGSISDATHAIALNISLLW